MSGFVDYKDCYYNSGAAWIAVGSIIFLGSVLSVIPQIVSIVRLRTSYGLNSIYIFVTTFSQFILVMNVVCLHTADFIGILQYPILVTIPRFLTFLVTFALWYGYLPIAFLNWIFFDVNIRTVRLYSKIQTERQLTKIFTCLPLITGPLFILLWAILGVVCGFTSTMMLRVGTVLGTACGFFVIVQYLPQFITTCKLKDNGSLSLLLLCIQAPGGTANALFMWLGQGDDWSTWISILGASIQQFVLLALCLFYKCKYHRRSDTLTDITGTSVATDELHQHLNKVEQIGF